MADQAVPREWNAGPVRDCPPVPLPDRVLAVARLAPDAIAIHQGSRRLTYRQLADGAAALAAELRALGVGPEIRVGVCARRHPATVTALIGSMLAGGAYVPLDPSHPRARLLDMIADAGVEVVVVDEAGRGLLADTGRAVSLVEPPATDPPPTPTVGCPAGLDNAAYALYTSGSTGRPKGVVVTHRNLATFLATDSYIGDLAVGDRTLAYSAFGFDVSVLDTLAPLTAGATVALVGDGDRLDPGRLQRFCEQHRITHAYIPPSLLPLLDPAGLPELRRIITGAEAPGPEQVARWAGSAEAPTRAFRHGYGPTEATVSATMYQTAGAWTTPLPIGYPLENYRVYVVDGALRPVPPGGTGELLIGGPAVARGYLDRPGLTAERFIPDLFGGTGERLYRTGDLVRWGPDGALMFLGRLDRQVKVRGQRVEIGEVETILRRHLAVSQAIVQAIDSAAGPGRELVGFVTPTTAPEPDTLGRYCADLLPAAMVPSRFVRLDRMPLTPSDKVDVEALRALLDDAAGVGGWEPDTVDGQLLARAWADILGTPPRTEADDFFARGGHSIAAMRLVARLRGDLGRDIEVEDILGGRTAGGILARIITLPRVDAVALPRASPPALSPSQHRLWFLNRLAPDATAYNIAMAERLTGPLDVPALRAALRAVATRHDILRWRIPDTEGVPYAVVDPPGDVSLPVVDVPHDELDDRLAAEAATHFDLATGPLWRVRLFRLAPDTHVLAVTAHHAVFDGWSEDLLYRDLAAAYPAAVAGRSAHLPATAAGYADYVAWRGDRARRRAEEDLDWWIGHLAGAPTVLDLPRDRPRPHVQSFAGDRLHRTLDRVDSAALRTSACDAGATPSAVLLAALGELLRRVTGRADLVLGTPAADRRHAAFFDLIGFFVEIVPLRIRVDDQTSFVDLVAGCRDELLAALAHPEAPLDRVVDALGIGGDPARNPLAQVLFNAYNFTAPKLELAGLECGPLRAAVPGSPFDLVVYAIERDGRFDIELVYNTDLYDRPRMAALADAYLNLVRALLADPRTPVHDVHVGGVAALADGLTDGITAPAPARRRAATPVGVTDNLRTDSERAIARIWCQTLGLPAVGATDNFFDIGGTSLLLATVRDRIAAHLAFELRLVDLFRYTNVRALAGYLDGTTGNRAVEQAAARGELRRRTKRRVVRRPALPVRESATPEDN